MIDWLTGNIWLWRNHQFGWEDELKEKDGSMNEQRNEGWISDSIDSDDEQLIITSATEGTTWNKKMNHLVNERMGKGRKGWKGLILWLHDQSIDWLIYCLLAYTWLIALVDYWLVDWLIDWVTDWLVDWFIIGSTFVQWGKTDNEWQPHYFLIPFNEFHNVRKDEVAFFLS